MVSAPSLSSPLKIGEVARRSGLTVKTIRFYCDEGLIQPISRSEGGYLRTLRAMEIPLTDVRQILAARRSGVCTCSELRGGYVARPMKSARRSRRCRVLQAELFGMLDGWEACGGRAPDPAPAVLVGAER